MVAVKFYDSTTLIVEILCQKENPLKGFFKKRKMADCRKTL